MELSDEPPDGIVLARMTLAGGAGFVHVRRPIGYALRFPSICEFRVDCKRRSITVHLAPGADPGLVPLLLTGNVAGFLLGVAGECLLHASAVKIDGEAVAFAGQSGSGKSTLAALFCAGGAKLLTDDVLRLEIDGDRCRCFPGTLELRLRSSAARLAALFPDAPRRESADKRIAIRPAPLNGRKESRVPLRAIVVPRLTRSATALRVERLGRAEALFALSRCPGMIGWQVDEPMRQQFRAHAHAAEIVPVLAATIPWGRQNSPQLRAALLRGLEGCGV